MTERHVRTPMLDVSLFRQPAFAGSNFLAFAAYFGTFSIFFFTALYLQVVANESAFQTALDFLPHGGWVDPLASGGPLVRGWQGWARVSLSRSGP